MSARTRIVPPPPPPTPIIKGGFPHPAICAMGLIGWMALIAVIAWAYFGAPQP